MLLVLLCPTYSVNAASYVTISFQDYGVRENSDCDFPEPLGKIVDEAKVSISGNDTIASVTLKLLDEKNILASYSGSAESGGGFYLEAIDNFTCENGSKVADGYGLGEFSAGQQSGWMISYNGVFIDKSASEYKVKSGDKIVWQYTASGLGEDIKNTTLIPSTAKAETKTEKVETTNTEKITETSEFPQTKSTTVSETSASMEENTSTTVAHNSYTENTTVVNSVKENKKPYSNEPEKSDNIILYIIFIIAGVVAVAIIICIIILYKDKKKREK